MEPKIFVQKSILIMVVLLLIVALLVAEIIRGEEVEIVPVIIAFVALVACFLLTYKMTICVDDEYVWFFMGIGLIRGSYEIGSISQCDVVKMKIYRSGVTLWRKKRIYNVGGLSGVELHFKESNKIVILGTNKPQEVCQAINESIEKFNSRKNKGNVN